MPGLHVDLLAEFCWHPGMQDTSTTSYSLVFGFQIIYGLSLDPWSYDLIQKIFLFKKAIYNY